jgi:hypothetical protein
LVFPFYYKEELESEYNLDLSNDKWDDFIYFIEDVFDRLKSVDMDAILINWEIYLEKYS